MLFYRIIATLAAPVLFAGLLLRWIRGRESLADIGQRLGGGTGIPGAIWLHGASNGELTSARQLIEALGAAFPAHPVVITANTVTGRDMVRGWRLDRVEARLAPLDFRWALARFRARWRPVLLVILENELWPNRIATAAEPVACVAARMSARSATRWARLGGLSRALLGRIDWLTAQDAGSAARFVSLGVDRARVGPVLSLKPGVRLAEPSKADLAGFRTVFERSDTLLAASTHAGEDAILLSGFAAARRENPRLRLILAPRHPRRAGEIAGLVGRAGLRVALRSKGEAPGPGTDVYLADTLGEMALWYALAGITFVGGSLVDKGGHTPYEPAQFGSAILHGPHVSNFTAAYDTLDAAGGAIRIQDAESLTAALADLRDGDRRGAMAHRASDNLGAANAGLETIVDALRRILAR